MWNCDSYTLEAAFRMVGELFSREGRRNVTKGVFLLLSGALMMIGVVYLVYGRGPQCVVRVENPRSHIRRHWYWPFKDPQLWLRTSAEVEEEAPNCR